MKKRDQGIVNSKTLVLELTGENKFNGFMQHFDKAGALTEQTGTNSRESKCCDSYTHC